MLRPALLMLGCFLAYNGYVAGTLPDPTPIPIPSPIPTNPNGVSILVKVLPDEDFPPKPTSQTLETSSKALGEALRGSKRDSLVLARAWREWAVMLSQSFRAQSIKSTQECSAISERCHEILLSEYTPEKEYAGQLSQAIQQVLLASFKEKGLADDSGIKNISWSEDAAIAATTAFNVMSYVAFEEYKKAHSTGSKL